MSNPSDTDRIERGVVIKAPRERVWRALSNAEEFGQWFGDQSRIAATSMRGSTS